MPEQENGASEQNEASEVICVMFVSNDQSAEVLKPSEKPFDLPAAPVPTKRSTVLGRCDSVSPMRSDHLDAPGSERFVQPVAVVGPIADQTFGLLSNEAMLKGGVDEPDLVRGSTLDVTGDRKTRTVCHGHEFRALAPLGLSHTAPPFFATTKVPSMKHSERSNPPRSFKSFANARSTRSHTPVLTQC